MFPFHIRMECAQFGTLNCALLWNIMLPVHMLNVSVKLMAIIHIRYATLCFALLLISMGEMEMWCGE